jgi:hypothetical protein
MWSPLWSGFADAGATNPFGTRSQKLNSKPRKKEEEILYRFKREDFFVALEHELERRLPEHLRQPALTLDTHHQVSVKNSRHAAYILVHMIKDLAHEFVIHPPAGMSEEEFVEEMVELVGRYLGRGKRYEV